MTEMDLWVQSVVWCSPGAGVVVEVTPASWRFFPDLVFARGECYFVLAMELLGVVQQPARVRRWLASLYLQELLDSGSMCSHRHLFGTSGDAVLVWLLSGMLVLWTEGGDYAAQFHVIFHRTFL